MEGSKEDSPPTRPQSARAASRNHHEDKADKILRGLLRTKLTRQWERRTTRRVDWYVEASSDHNPAWQLLGLPAQNCAYLGEHESSSLNTKKLVRLMKLLSDEQARDPSVHGLIISIHRPDALIRKGILKACQTPGMWRVPPMRDWLGPLYLYVMVPRALPRTPSYYFWRTLDPNERPFAARNTPAPSLEDIMNAPSNLAPNDQLQILDRYFDYLESDPQAYHLSPRVKARLQGQQEGRIQGLKEGREKGHREIQDGLLKRARAQGIDGLRALAQAIAPWIIEQLQEANDLEEATEIVREAMDGSPTAIDA